MNKLHSKHFWTLIILIIFITSIVIPINNIINIPADSNKPNDMSNGWWNTTGIGDWEIDTLGNLWENKNISVAKSFVIKFGGGCTFINCILIVDNSMIFPLFID